MIFLRNKRFPCRRTNALNALNETLPSGRYFIDNNPRHNPHYRFRNNPHCRFRNNPHCRFRNNPHCRLRNNPHYRFRYLMFRTFRCFFLFSSATSNNCLRCFSICFHFVIDIYSFFTSIKGFQLYSSDNPN